MLRFITLPALLALFASGGVAALVETNGALRGTVTLETSGKPVHNVTMTILQLKRSTETDDNGNYEFTNVPPGTYDVLAHLDRVPDVVQNTQIGDGATVTVDFQIRLRAVGEQITVTASGGEETALNSIQSVTSLTAVELSEKNLQSVGEALDHELGVAKQSSGPATSRPVVRGFSGERVAVLQDGNGTGSLSAQSGDHAEPIDVLSLEKLEVVKGPATLLYGSSAMGGVVNAITGHDSAHQGLRGYVTGIGSTNSYQAGGGAGIEYGTKNWLFWGSGGAQRSGDYETSIGRVTNSFSREGNGDAGIGYYPGNKFFSLDYTFDRRRYGIPFDQQEQNPEVINLDPKRDSIRFNAGVRDLDSFISGVQTSLQYNNYRHDETNSITDVVNTSFENKTFSYRALADERKTNRWSGSFGVWGVHRDYSSAGEEAIAPPTIQNSFALFGLEKLDLERVAFQFGGRYEHNGLNPTPFPDRPVPARSFDALSGAVGVRVNLWKGGAFVANYSHSTRAPSIEELYNDGPHGGTATFEIGDPNLKLERGDGIDLSIRHSNDHVRAEANYFYYHMSDFVFLAPTGAVDPDSGFVIANYAQGKTRYTGAEGKFDVALHKTLWLLSEVDYVNAQLTDGTPLPRIPPLRGRLGLEATIGGFRIAPEALMVHSQDRLFPNETRTAGYTVFNVNASYSFAEQHFAQVISLNAFNIGDRLYRNHVSFIKDFTPEIGRGVRLTYTIRFF